MMRKAYTLIEIIITVAITGILSVGMFKAFEAVTLRSEKAKILTTLSIDSQSALDQLSTLLYNRIPISVREKASDGSWNPLDDDETDFRAIEWYGTASESHLLQYYSGFVDIVDSNNSTHTLVSPDTDLENVRNAMRIKWDNAGLDLSDMGLIFSGTFDEGAMRNDTTLSPYEIDNASTGSSIIISNPQSPMRIYEKYSLVDSAYAVALGSAIDKDADCIRDLNISDTAINNTLLLFYDYRPWKTGGKHFCADTENPDTTGKAAVLGTNVDDFRVTEIDSILRLKINMKRDIRGGNPVRISKQKAVF